MPKTTVDDGHSARLDAIENLRGLLIFIADWIQRKPNGLGFSLGKGETLLRHIDVHPKKAELHRVYDIRAEYRDCLEALDRADPDGIKARRTFRELRIESRVSQRRLYRDSTDPVFLARHPTLSIACNRTADELWALAERLSVEWREVRALQLYGPGTDNEQGPATGGKAKRPRGRPKGTRTTDPKLVARITKAWDTGCYKTYAECARELGDVDALTVRRTIDARRK